MSQFAFLQAEFPDIFAHAARAENLAHADPRAAAFYGRLALETAVEWLYRRDRTLKLVGWVECNETHPTRFAPPILRAKGGR